LKYYEDYFKLSKELFEAYPNHVEFKNGLAISYSKLGSTHTSLGNLDKALKYYEDYFKLSKELFEAYPNHVAFKNGLAISYYKLGAFSRDNLKDNKKALDYFQKAEKIWIELVRDAPQYSDFKRFLKILQKEMADLEK
jgi:tetratricopeptide (TPR) repeat protein